MIDLILETALPGGDIKALYEWQQNAHKPFLAKLAAKDAEIERLQTENNHLKSLELYHDSEYD